MTNLHDIVNLIYYAENKLALDKRNRNYKANRLLEILNSGLEGGDLEDAIFGELSLLPSQINNMFSRIYKKSGAKAATDWLYNYCVNNKYVKKDVLDKNPRFDTSNGLTITINKAKPEFRDPKKAAQGNSVDSGFAKCVICRENEGYAAKNKRNLRTVSLNLNNKKWFWQYSPYGYFNEHGIAVNCEHIPMHIDRGTLENLVCFVDKFPHYFIGCNASLPRIGGSVLAHDHYQGGGEVLPLHKAKIKTVIFDKNHPNVTIGILDWPGTVVRISSGNKDDIIDIADKIRTAWVKYSNPALGIIAEDGDGVHNSISPTVIKTADGYDMNVILRSNITSEQYPDGVFHAHPEYHAIKKESIGLIEAQGLFILPGRLEEELNELERLITEKQPLPDSYAQFSLVYEEAKELYESGRYGDIHTAMKEEMGNICYRILENTAVFKHESDFLAFLESVGLKV